MSTTVLKAMIGNKCQGTPIEVERRCAVEGVFAARALAVVEPGERAATEGKSAEGGAIPLRRTRSFHNIVGEVWV
jgi:hypothetical protein